jgi:hypothetical protein
MSGSASRRYPPEMMQRAVRMVAEIRGEDESEWAAMHRGLSGRWVDDGRSGLR